MGQEIIARAASDREPASGKNLADAIRARIEPLGGVELELPHRQPIRDRCLFGELSDGPLDTGR